MFTIKTEQYFDSAHFLSGYEGKCSNIHGHRWKVEVEIYSKTLSTDTQTRAMVVDFSDLKRDLTEEADAMDHALIYETGSLKATTLAALTVEGFRMIEVPFRPTAEEFAKYFFYRMKERGYSVKCACVFETPNNIATYCEN